MTQCMVAISFRGRAKADVKAHFEAAGILLYEDDEIAATENMIVLKKYVFEDHPKDYIGFLFEQLGVWDFSFTGWKLHAWEERFGPV